MSVVASLDFDSLSEDATVAPDSPWSTVGGSFTAVAAAAHDGAMGARLSDTGTSSALMYTYGSAVTVAYASYWFNIRTAPSGKLYLGSVYDSSSTHLGDWRVNEDDTVSIRDGNTAVATSSATLASGFYRGDWKMDVSAGTQELKVYADGDSTAVVDVSGSLTGSDLWEVKFGAVVAASGGALDMDTLQVLDDWPDPPSSGTTGPSWWLKTATGAIAMTTTIVS